MCGACAKTGEGLHEAMQHMANKVKDFRENRQEHLCKDKDVRTLSESELKKAQEDTMRIHYESIAHSLGIDIKKDTSEPVTQHSCIVESLTNSPYKSDNN